MADPVLGPLLAVLILIAIAIGLALLWAIVIPRIWWLLTGQVVVNVGRYRRIHYRVIRKETPPWRKLLDRLKTKQIQSISPRRTMQIPYIRGKTAKSVVFYLAVSMMVAVGVFYTWRVPPVPVVTTDFRTHTTTISHGVVVIKDVFVVRMSLTTVASTSTVVKRENEYEVIVYSTLRKTFIENYQTTSTSWSEYYVTITEPVRTTRHQTLTEAYPTLWPVLLATVVGASVMILAYRKFRS